MPLENSSLIEVAIEPMSPADNEKLSTALQVMVSEDDSFAVSLDHESGQTILKGQSERHLDGKVRVLRETYGVDANIGAPQVAYREALSRNADIDHAHKRQAGGVGEFARVVILFELGEPGSGFVFESRVGAGTLPINFILAVEKGLDLQKELGLVAGFPLIDFKATLIDGALHPIDSSVLSFEIAARGALKRLRDEGAPKVLEPVMAVEVSAPSEALSDVIRDLNGRRGTIRGQTPRGDTAVLHALVPLANMFGYETVLSGISQGRAHVSMHFDHYAAVPTPHDDDPTFRPAMGMRA